MSLLASITSSAIETLNRKSATVSVVGALSGWKAFDWLHASQLTAALLASLVSLCALILTGPKAWRTLRVLVSQLFRK